MLTSVTQIPLLQGKMNCVLPYLGVISIWSSKNHCLGFDAPHGCWF